MGLFGKKRGTTPKQQVRTLTAIYFPKVSGYEHIPVTGEAHYLENLLRITGRSSSEQVRLDTKAVLVPEPTNPEDKNAVQVQIDTLVVGYLNWQVAKGYVGPLTEAAGMDRVVTCDAWVSSPEGGTGFGVRLFLPRPDDFGDDLRKRLPYIDEA